jgi:hypothetical protein
MKKVNGKDVLVIQTANETEIAMSKKNLENAQHVLNLMVNVLSFMEDNLCLGYEDTDRRAHAVIVARQQFEEGMEAISTLIANETMTIALDSVGLSESLPNKK